MGEENPVLVKMGVLLAGWEGGGDRRLIFLQCYRMMTRNVLAAVEAGFFEDNAWVRGLMENFAGYYFRALDAFAIDPSTTPEPWKITFEACGEAQTHVLQNLILGVNAHINYDLVLSLAELLGPVWQDLSPEMRSSRYRDYCRINDIIYQTINPVQDQVLERFAPAFDLIDRFFGPVDEWITSRVINLWREDVWNHARQMCECLDGSDRPQIVERVERSAVARAQEILGRGAISGMFGSR